MKYKIISSKQFTNQIKNLDKKSKRIIFDKKKLIKENPFRFKKIHSNFFSKVFRIRLKIKSQERRLIYAIITPEIILVCLLDRKNDYNDLEKYLKKVN
jgi:mRNA-degrading endonuclease RelE of RelBE toxin-antitoxin system